MEFQLTRPRGTRLQTSSSAACQNVFQLTRPRGTRRCSQLQMALCTNVSTHASAGDATSGLPSFSLTTCFNSRVRGGRDTVAHEDDEIIIVSTHASAGDATFKRRANPPESGVSTHASAGDATFCADAAQGGVLFQLTRPRGTRRNVCAAFRESRVSTHASAGDATTCICVRSPAQARFNSRVRGGRDAVTLDEPVNNVVSTHASAGDATLRFCMRFCAVCFNSRVRGGRDPRAHCEYALTVFQLTRPRGTRPAPRRAVCRSPCFNSRVRGGRDVTTSVEPGGVHVFQLTRPRGTRPVVLPYHHQPIKVSTHASAGDATRMSSTAPRAGNCFNSRVRGGRDISG